VGFAIGRWWAILLVSLLPILAIPVPRPEDAYEPFPMWFTCSWWESPSVRF